MIKQTELLIMVLGNLRVFYLYALFAVNLNVNVQGTPNDSD
jgi:hypothetical protein